MAILYAKVLSSIDVDFSQKEDRITPREDGNNERTSTSGELHDIHPGGYEISPVMGARCPCLAKTRKVPIWRLHELAAQSPTVWM
jgi:hypothetical protein